ncbi:MAG: Ig-like domain-containing protein, partial [Bacteroidota bacterium]
MRLTQIIIFLTCGLLSHLLPAQAGLLVTAAQGTGRTTGHVITLTVENKSNAVRRVLPATYYIPSDGKYQAYVGRIFQQVLIPSGEKVTIPVVGYCTQVNRPPLTAGEITVPFSKWVAIRNKERPPAGMTLLTPSAVVAPWEVKKIPDKLPFLISGKKPSTGMRFTWPGTKLVINGTVNIDQDVKAVAPLIVAALEQIERITYLQHYWDLLRTPLSGDPLREAVVINQHTFWLAMATLTGDDYGQDEFRARIYRQLAGDSVLEGLSEDEKNRIEADVAGLWKIFKNTARTAKLLKHETADEENVSLPIDQSEGDECEQYELRLIDLTFACRDDHCGAVEAAIAEARRQVNAIEQDTTLKATDPTGWETRYQASWDNLNSARQALSSCQRERVRLCGQADQLRTLRDSCLIARDGVPLIEQDAEGQLPYPWSKIELTNGLMKAVPVDVVEQLWQTSTAEKSTESLSAWLPIGTGAIVGGALYWIISEVTSSPENPSPPVFVVTDDEVSVSCEDAPLTISPLDNDEGVDLSIVSINFPDDIAVNLIGDNQIIIDNLIGQTEFTGSVEVQDSSGATMVSQVVVTVNNPSVSAVNDAYEVAYQDTLNGNLLANDSNGVTEVIDFSTPEVGELTVNTDGTFHYVAPPGFTGEVQFTYKVDGVCEQSSTGIVTITVLPPSCDFTVNSVRRDADCALATGGVSLTVVSEFTDLQYNWSTEDTLSNITDVPAGEYAVTITALEGLCDTVLTFAVNESEPNFINNFTTR